MLLDLTPKINTQSPLISLDKHYVCQIQTVTYQKSACYVKGSIFCKSVCRISPLWCHKGSHRWHFFQMWDSLGEHQLSRKLQPNVLPAGCKLEGSTIFEIFWLISHAKLVRWKTKDEKTYWTSDVFYWCYWREPSIWKASEDTYDFIPRS